MIESFFCSAEVGGTEDGGEARECEGSGIERAGRTRADTMGGAKGEAGKDWKSRRVKEGETIREGRWRVCRCARDWNGGQVGMHVREMARSKGRGAHRWIC